MMMKNKNVPKIRFKGFAGEWEETELRNIAEDFYGGGTPKTSINEYWNGNIPWIQTSDLIEGRISGLAPQKYISAMGLKESATKLVPEDSIAIITRVGVGKLSLIPFKYSTSQDFLSMSKLKINERFAVYAIHKKMQTVLNEVQGTSIKGITKEELLSKKIATPTDSDEQIKIGDYFQNIDKLIETNQTKLDKLKNIKKACLEKMFPKKGSTLPEIRFKGFSEEWKSELLDELADFSKGSGYSKSDLCERGIPIVLYGRLYTKYETIISNVDTFVKENKGSITSKGNEVIVPASGETAEDIARASTIMQSGVILGGDLNVIYPSKEINSVFLALSISNGLIWLELSKKAQGKSVVHLRNGDLQEVKLSYPQIKEQTQIGTFFQNLDNLIAKNEHQLTKLKNIKKGCLEKMFVNTTDAL